MSDFDEAEIIDATDISEAPCTNPNQTQNIVNLVNILPGDSMRSLPEKSISSISKDTIDNVVSLYNEYNERYGFKVEFNVSELASNFKDIIDPDKMKVFEIYLSEAFARFRLVFFQRSIITISELLDQVSNPALLKDPALTIEYKYGMMSKLFELMGTATQLYEQIKVEDVDIKLRNMDKADTENTSKISKDPNTLKVMEMLNKISLKGKSNEENNSD